MFGLIMPFKVWFAWLCVNMMNYGLWLMSLTWIEDDELGMNLIW